MTTEIAQVARRLPAGQEIMSGPNHQLQVQLRRAVKRRELARISPLYEVEGQPGTVYCVVQRHKAPEPAWLRPAKVAALVSPAVIGIGYAVTMVVRSIAGAVTQTAPILGGVAVIGLALLVASALVRSGSGRIVEGTFRARIK